MSSEPHQLALAVRGLSKSFTLRGRRQERPTTLADALMNRLRHPFRRQPDETFWALSDVSFDVPRGTVVGVIGRNGAGKSTLLKILSRIVAPASGEVDLYGRVGSLLEIGTGFHQELTGRENIYLNGAILGMSRAEIRKYFDAIVDFAGIDKFLDTPVKRYSSGMYVRLAFAVAAHLRTDILLVDEVLAVGDAEFQRKCLARMKDASTDGRTVLFVSHHMHSVALLCDSVLLLENGRLVMSGDVESVIGRYSASLDQHAESVSDPHQRAGTGEFRFAAFRPTRRLFDPSEEKRFHFEIREWRRGAGRFHLSAHLFNELGAEIARFDSRLLGAWSDRAVDRGELSFGVPWLRPGRYHLDAYLWTESGVVDAYERACSFDVSELLPYPHATAPASASAGLVLGDFCWSLDGRRASTRSCEDVLPEFVGEQVSQP